MLRSPVPTIASCSRSASIQKPLPSRPRSASVPSIAELPAELPGSLLLENGGYSSCTSPVPARPITQIIRSESHPPYKFLDYEKVSLDALNLASAPIAHARSVPELSSRFSATRTMCSSRAFEFNTLIQPDAPVIPQKHHSSELGFRRRSRRDLVKSPPPMEGVRSRKRSSRHGPNQVRREVKPVPQIKEEKVSDREVERRRRCRDEVSTLCFLLYLCLLDKQKDCMTKQFQNFSIALPPTLLRQYVPELDVPFCHQATMRGSSQRHSAGVSPGCFCGQSVPMTRFIS